MVVKYRHANAMSVGSFILLVLLIHHYECYSIVDYPLEKSLTQGFSARQINNAVWVISIRQTAIVHWNVTEEKLFMKQLKPILKQDNCHLKKSGSFSWKHDDVSHNRRLIIEVHCMPVKDKKKKKTTAPSDERLEKKIDSPLMKHTVHEYLIGLFGAENIIVEKNLYHHRPRPTYWYGSERNLEDMLRLQRQEHGKSVEEKKWLRSQRPAAYRFEEDPRDKLMHKKDSVENNAPWDLVRISMRLGLLSTQYYYLNNGSNCDAYIIDTGINVANVDFGGRAVFLGNTIGDGINTDLNGHGTHVAGLVGGRTYGVAKGITLYAVKVLDGNGDGTLGSITMGMMMAIEQASLRKPRRGVINLSLGGPKSTLVDDAVISMVQNGLFVAIAAGNDYGDACAYSPSDLGGGANNGILTVGASDIYDSRAVFSNDGPCVDIFAPGVSIASDWFTGSTATEVLSGTSMATPLVLGVAALVLNQNLTLSPSEVRSVVLQQATPNVISGTSTSGDLLYSLIDLSTIRLPITPAPTFVVPPPVPVPIQWPTFHQPFSATRRNAMGLTPLFLFMVLPCLLDS